MTVGILGVYLLKVSTLLIILYLFNYLLLSRETLHRLNRVVWLTTVVIAFILPLIPTHILNQSLSSTTFVEEIAVLESLADNNDATNIATLNNSAIITVVILFSIYIIGLLLCLLYNIVSYFALYKLIIDQRHNLFHSDHAINHATTTLLKSCEQIIGIKQRVNYIIHDEQIAPLSWKNYVIISRDDLEESGREIILHELSHIRSHHYIDIIVINIASIILWFNPAIWLTKSAMQQVHEYSADQSVLAAGSNIKEYQLLIIKKAVGKSLYSIANNLNHSNLKKRITMMSKKKSPKMAGAKLVYAIPLTILTVVLFASPALANYTCSISSIKITNYFNINKIEGSKTVSTAELQDSTLASAKPVVKSIDMHNQDNVITLSGTSEEKPPLAIINNEKVDLKEIPHDKINSISVIKSGHDNYLKLKIWEKYNIDDYCGLIIITLKEEGEEQYEDKILQ